MELTVFAPYLHQALTTVSHRPKQDRPFTPHLAVLVQENEPQVPAVEIALLRGATGCLRIAPTASRCAWARSVSSV